VELSVAGLPVVNESQLGGISGTAPPAYAPPPAGANLNLGSGILGLLTATGVLSSSVASNVEGLTGERLTSASGQVTGLNLTLADPPLLPALLTIGGNGSVIASQCRVQGDSISSLVTGAATLTNVSLSILGQVVNLPANPAPNSVVPVAGGVAGLTIYLNEQSPVSGTAGTQIQCTALRIKLDGVNVLGIGLISGEIKAGLSSATQFADSDGDGLADGEDGDSDGDGIPNAVEVAQAPANGDSDGDGSPNHLDLDSDNDGINDVIEAGGTDTNGDGFQDGSADADRDGIIDTVDESRGGTALPVPDTDGDGARDYIDLDSDNDTVSDLLEGGSGGRDTNHDGMVDGTDTDGDGIRDEVDSLAGFGDASDPAPANTDGTDQPDYLDPDSDNAGGPDIETAGNRSLDTDGDGRIDGPVVDPDHDGVDVRVDTIADEFGGTGGCQNSGSAWRRAKFSEAELGNPEISGWAADPDHDGISNAMEFLTGSDPRVHSPPPDLPLTFHHLEGLNVTLERDSCARAFVGIEYSTNLLDWTQGGPGVEYLNDSPSTMIVRVTGDASGGSTAVIPTRLFVRLRITVP